MNGRTAAMRRLARTLPRAARRFASPLHNSAPDGPPIHNSAPEGPAIHNSAPEGPAIHNSAPEGPAIHNSAPGGSAIHNSASGPFSYTQFGLRAVQLYTIRPPGRSAIHNSARRSPAPRDPAPCPSAVQNPAVRALQRPYPAPRPVFRPPYAHDAAFRRDRTGPRRPSTLQLYTIRRSYTQFGAAIHNSPIHNSAPNDRPIHNSARPGRRGRRPAEPLRTLPAARR